MKKRIVSMTAFRLAIFRSSTLDQLAADHSTEGRFGSSMTKAVTFDLLFKEINKQLATHQNSIKTGVIETPLRPKEKANHSPLQREEEQ